MLCSELFETPTVLMRQRVKLCDDIQAVAAPKQGPVEVGNRKLRARLQKAGLPVDEATFRGIEATSLAIQVLGGYGYTPDYPVERHWRDVRKKAGGAWL